MSYHRGGNYAPCCASILLDRGGRYENFSEFLRNIRRSPERQLATAAIISKSRERSAEENHQTILRGGCLELVTADVDGSANNARFAGEIHLRELRHLGEGSADIDHRRFVLHTVIAVGIIDETRRAHRIRNVRLIGSMETGQTIISNFRVENLNRTFRSTVFETDGRRRHVRSTSQHRIQRLSVLIVSENRAVDDLRALGEAALRRIHINDRGTIGIHHIDDRTMLRIWRSYQAIPG